MDPVHVHLVATILLVQVSAVWLDRTSTLPYFPIEISRTAAESPMANVVLRVGFTTLIVTCILTQTLSWPRFILWFGLMLVAFFPDTVHMARHMSGVGILFVAACLQLSQTWNMQRGLLLLFALFLYVERIVLKFVVLWLTDQRLSDHWAGYGLIKGFAMRNQEIMFGLADPVPTDTLVFFKLGAVGQWLCFFVLSHLF